MAGRRRSTRRHRREPIRQKVFVQHGVADVAVTKALNVADTGIPRVVPEVRDLLDFTSLRRDLSTSLLLGLGMVGAVIAVAQVIE